MCHYKRRNPRTLLEAKAKKLQNELRLPGACFKRDFSEIELELAIAMYRGIIKRKKSIKRKEPVLGYHLRDTFSKQSRTVLVKDN